MLRAQELVIGAPNGHFLISLEVPAAQVVAAVAAPQPATALARTLVGLAAPTSGRVYVADRDVTELPPVQRHIGYVPAGGALLPHLTIADNIQYGVRRRELVREVSRSWQLKVIDGLELAPALNLRPHQLSVAQRLRAACARALACLPEVLVVDLPEASSAGSLADLTMQVLPGIAVLVCSADPDVVRRASTAVPIEEVTTDAT